LFTFDDEIGRGLPLWLPHGTVIRDELERLMQELEFDAGFVRVATPHIARVELYRRTGHLPYYADSMFPVMQNARDPHDAFVLKPMNCPHHHKIFAARNRSYRELPFRISEYGHVYRYEDSGAVSGLLRTRCMCMNDAHIYCTRDQIVSELSAVLDMHQHVYALLDSADQSLGKRIRLAAVQKVPNVLVVGERECVARTVSLRSHGGEQRSVALDEFRGQIAQSIAARALDG
jgi:threonyl-tRNA synthetase